MLGLNVIGINTPSALDCYNLVQDTKNDKIAVVIANNTGKKDRASATMIGGTFGLFQSVLFAATYGLGKKFPSLQKCPPIKWAVGQIDKWIKAVEKIHPDKSHSYHVRNGVMNKALYLIGSGAALGYAADWYSTYSNTRTNGKISNIKQGEFSNSGLISALNSLSSTDEGKEIIKNSMKRNDDNSITIKFKGVDREYNITKKELKEATKQYVTHENENGKITSFKKKYSKGDGDVLAFELALDKFKQDIKNNNITPDKNIPDYVFDSTENQNVDKNTATKQAYYLLTGETSPEINTENNDNIENIYAKASLNKFINEYTQNPTKYAASVKFKESENNKTPIRTRFYAKTNLKTDKEYTIYKINSKYATIVNTANTKERIEIPINTLKQEIASLCYVNVNKQNTDNK